MNRKKTKQKIKWSCLLVAAFMLALAIPIEAAQVDLHWTANPPEQQVTSYNVYVATNGTSNPVLLGTSTTNSYSTTVNPGYVYYFTLKANNLAGTSGASPPTATPNVPSPPAAPTVNISP